MLSLLTPQITLANNYEEAVRKASEAYLIQSGYKDNLEEYARTIERQYIPVVIVQNGSVLVFLINGFAGDQWKIGYKWEF